MPVGGSVDEGVAILLYVSALCSLAGMKLVERLGGGVGLPSRVLCPSDLPLVARGAEALWSRVRVPSLREGLAYKTTRKYHDKVARTRASNRH